MSKFVGPKVWVVALAASGFVFASRAQAAPITAPDALFPAPVEAGPVAGTVLGTRTTPVSAATFTGSLTSQVIRGDTSNPYGTDKLTFTYQFSNTTAGAPNAVNRISVRDFTSYLTDVSAQDTGTGLLPTLIDRNSPDVIGFSFLDLGAGSLGPINPGQTSRVLVVQTNAIGFGDTQALIVDGSSATVSAFGPADPIPEPGTAGLLALGAGALGLRRRRR